MNRLIALLMLGAAAPAVAQSMDHSGHEMAPSPAPAADPHAGHQMAPATAESEAATETETVSAPEPAKDWAADALYPPGEMAVARNGMLQEHGGMSFSQIMFNIAEIGVRKGRDAYRWDGEGWFGGDIDRLVVKSEGEGVFREGIESAEVQALWSHALDAYWNVQTGVRQDIGPGATPTHLTVGVEGLAPYWFEVEGALFLSQKGDMLGRIEAYYDQRLTQRLVLQPRVEVNFAAQDVPETGTGSGISDGSFDLRLRYEIKREFAPYVGVSFERQFGDTARYSRAAGEGTHSTSFVAGVRFWF